MANLVDFEFKPTDADIVMHNKCDKYDIMLSVGCGAVAGLVDSFFVGMPGASKLGTLTDKLADDMARIMERLPDDADINSLTATFDNGKLMLTMNKLIKETTPKTIDVRHK